MDSPRTHYTITFENLTAQEVKFLHQVLLQQPMGAVEGMVSALRAQINRQDAETKEKAHD